MSDRTARRLTANSARANGGFHDARRQALAEPKHADMPPAAVSIKDFRLATGVCQATVFRWLADGKLKSTKVGGRRLIAYSEIPPNPFYAPHSR